MRKFIYILTLLLIFTVGNCFGQADEGKAIPARYAFESFKRLANNLSYDKFKKIAVVNNDGVYNAVFIRNNSESVSLLVTSRKNCSDDYTDRLRKAKTAKGISYYYGDFVTGSKAIVVDLDRFDTYVIISLPDSLTFTDGVELLSSIDF